MNVRRPKVTEIQAIMQGLNSGIKVDLSRATEENKTKTRKTGVNNKVPFAVLLLLLLLRLTQLHCTTRLTILL